MALQMQCCVVVKQGPRKGLKCQNPAEDSYCGRLVRQKEYDNFIKEGKNPCNQFFRACNNLVKKANIRCETCLENSRTKKNPCKYDKCKNHVLEENTYCKKHERHTYYDEEKEKDIKYCDIGRGCFTLLEKGGKASCESCLEKEREYDNKRYTKNREFDLDKKDIKFIQGQSADVVKNLLMVTISLIPIPIPVVPFLIIFGKKIGIDILPKEHEIPEKGKKKDKPNESVIIEVSKKKILMVKSEINEEKTLNI